MIEKIKGKTLLTTHISPDDDAISSILTMNHILKKHKIKNEMMITGDQKTRWQYFQNFDKIKFVEDIADFAEDFETIIVLDGNKWSRFSKKEKPNKNIICIDHHEGKSEFKTNIINTKKTSTIQIIYEEFLQNQKLTKKQSETALLGILGDTGNFSFVKKQNSEVLEIAKKLIDTGIEIQQMQTKYQKMNQKSLNLIGILMKNAKTKKLKNYPLMTYSYLEKKDVENINSEIVSAATSYFTNAFLRKLEGSDWGIMLKPGKGGTKISLRSIGNVDVSKIATDLKIGGGHKNASGGFIKMPLKKTLKHIINFLENQ
ncbi:MAG: DHH family phosphoesterase [Candidatus Woesearchaeota archaeon]